MCSEKSELSRRISAAAWGAFSHRPRISLQVILGTPPSPQVIRAEVFSFALISSRAARGPDSVASELCPQHTPTAMRLPRMRTRTGHRAPPLADNGQEGKPSLHGSLRLRHRERLDETRIPFPHPKELPASPTQNRPAKPHKRALAV